MYQGRPCDLQREVSEGFGHWCQPTWPTTRGVLRSLVSGPSDLEVCINICIYIYVNVYKYIVIKSHEPPCILQHDLVKTLEDAVDFLGSLDSKLPPTSCPTRHPKRLKTT